MSIISFYQNWESCPLKLPCMLLHLGTQHFKRQNPGCLHHLETLLAGRVEWRILGALPKERLGIFHWKNCNSTQDAMLRRIIPGRRCHLSWICNISNSKHTQGCPHHFQVLMHDSVEVWKFPNCTVIFHDDPDVECLLNKDWREFPYLQNTMKCLVSGMARQIFGDTWCCTNTQASLLTLILVQVQIQWKHHSRTR